MSILRLEMSAFDANKKVRAKAKSLKRAPAEDSLGERKRLKGRRRRSSETEDKMVKSESEDEEYKPESEEEEEEDEDELVQYQVLDPDDEGSLSGNPTIVKVGADKKVVANDDAPAHDVRRVDDDDDTEEAVACPCNSACHRAILLSLRRVRRDLDANNRLLQRLLGAQRFLPSDSPVLPADFPVTLPIVDVGDLDVLETYLSEAAKFAETLPYFSSLGGVDAKKTFKRIMNTLLSYEAGKDLNWRGKGRRNKKAFETYTRMHNLIFHSVKQNPRALEVTLTDIEKFMKEWLRFAPDRYLRFVQSKGLQNNNNSSSKGTGDEN